MDGAQTQPHLPCVVRKLVTYRERHVRFGSKADIRRAKSHVRFTPKKRTLGAVVSAPNGRHRFDHIVGASWPAFCSATEGSKALDFMEDKLALLYLIFMLIITIAYVEVSPTKHAQPTPIVTRIQAASE